jgi:hypothetical protein
MEKTLSEIIRDWVNVNKTVFWKYEVSSFYQTYKINIANLPKPSKEDIKVVSHNRILSNAQKNQLCDIIKKVNTKTYALKKSSIDVKIDYIKGAVIAAVI